MFKTMKKLFRKDDARLKRSFAAIRRDMHQAGLEHEALKESVNEWIIFLEQSNEELRERVQMLERKLVDQADEAKLSLLKNI